MTLPPKIPEDQDIPDMPLPGLPGEEPYPDIFPDPMPDPMPDPDPIPVHDPQLPQPGEIVPPIHSAVFV